MQLTNYLGGLILALACPPAVWATDADSADEAADDATDAIEIGYELQSTGVARHGDTLGDDANDKVQELNLEFTIGLRYPILPQLTFFAEGIALIERQRTDAERDWRTEQSLERGQLWLRWHPRADDGFALQLGRQEFSEDRQWWWDEDLDALRLDYTADDWTLTTALAKESAPRSTLEDDIDPADDEVVRALGNLRWDWAAEQRLEGFALYQRDRSPTPGLGDAATEEDEVDADLTWLGLRADGDLTLGDYGSLAYWLDAAHVRGHEDVLGFDESDDGRILIAERRRQDVRAWALDVGGVWTLPVAGQAQLLFGYALGSGDSTPDQGVDRSFRQTGLQDNTERLQDYGELFNPELSNLRVLSLGVGWPLFEDGQIALMHYRYRQDTAAPFLRETNIDRDPEGDDPDLGWEWDVIFTLETEAGLSVEAIASMFEAGRAFGEADGERAFRAYLQLTYEF